MDGKIIYLAVCVPLLALGAVLGGPRAQEPPEPMTWAVSVTYENGEVWSLDNLAELHLDIEAGEMVTTDYTGYSCAWNLGGPELAESITITH